MDNEVNPFFLVTKLGYDLITNRVDFWALNHYRSKPMIDYGRLDTEGQISFTP